MAFLTSQNQVTIMRKALFDQGFLGEQFTKLECLEVEKPNFVLEMVTLFFEEAIETFDEIENIVEESRIDINTLLVALNRYHSSTLSIGAKKLNERMVSLKTLCKNRNVESFEEEFEKVKGEHETLKNKLETYIELAKQFGPGETAYRPF